MIEFILQFIFRLYMIVGEFFLIKVMDKVEFVYIRLSWSWDWANECLSSFKVWKRIVLMPFVFNRVYHQSKNKF